MNEKRFGYFVHNINEDDEYYEIIDEEERYSFNFVTDEGLASQVCSCLNEQQATIRRLQDLCGESDGENVKLRLKNKKLKDDLHNCRLNKNIISEKLKVWQDAHKEYNIYNIKDFEESFKLDAKINKEKDEKIKELEVNVLNLELEIKRLEKMIWKIQWRFQQEVGIEKAREHYREIDKEMKE